MVNQPPQKSNKLIKKMKKNCPFCLFLSAFVTMLLSAPVETFVKILKIFSQIYTLLIMDKPRKIFKKKLLNFPFPMPYHRQIYVFLEVLMAA